MKTKHNILAATVFLAGCNAAFGQPTVQFSASTYTVAESGRSVTLTVERSNDTGTAVSVDYATADGTATAGLKYTSTNGTLTFAVGDTSEDIVVPILNEGFVEGTKTFNAILSNATAGAVLGTRTNATVSIIDNDVGVQFMLPTYSVTEDGGAVLLGVVRGDDGTFPVTVDLVTSDITAAEGEDYTGVTTNLAFAGHERFKLVPIAILNDSVKEASKTFLATLSNPVGARLGNQKTTTVTNVDNDQGFAFESATRSVAEDAGVALVTVLRGTDDTNSASAVELATVDNSAIRGLDYSGFTNRWFEFAPGERQKVVPISILNDGVKENLFENFTVALSNSTGGVLGTRTTTIVSIADNDPGVGFEQTRYTNAWGEAADLVVNVLRGNDGSLGPITVDFATGGGTATAGIDYQGTNGTLAFDAGETVKSLNIPLLRPRLAGTPKTFQVALSNPTGGVTLGTSNATLRILGTYATVGPSSDPALRIRREWGVNVLSWIGGAQLQRADKVTGPWQTLLNATTPHTVQTALPATFYRVTRPRPVNLYVPTNYNGQTALPLVILLHAGGFTAQWEEDQMRLRPQADARGFLYCYPEGTPALPGGPSPFLNAWFDNPTDAAAYLMTNVNDAGYLRDLIEEVAARFALGFT